MELPKYTPPDEPYIPYSAIAINAGTGEVIKGKLSESYIFEWEEIDPHTLPPRLYTVWTYIYDDLDEKGKT